MSILTKDQVTIGRLRKKIERLLKTRDCLNKQVEHYQAVIAIQPFIESRYQDHIKTKEERERVKDLERRVKEQELLIRLLGSEKIADYTINNAYAEIIKQEHLVRNLKK